MQIHKKSRMAEKVQYIVTRLSDGDLKESKVMDYLRRLKGISMTLDILQSTGVGKVVNRLRKRKDACEPLARELVAEWRDIAAVKSEKEENDGLVSVKEAHHTTRDKRAEGKFSSVREHHMQKSVEADHKSKSRHSDSRKLTNGLEKHSNFNDCEEKSMKMNEKTPVDKSSKRPSSECNIFDLALSAPAVKKPKHSKSETSSHRSQKDEVKKKYRSSNEAVKENSHRSKFSAIEAEIDRIAPKPSEQVRLSVQDILNDDTDHLLPRPVFSTQTKEPTYADESLIGTKRSSKTMVFSGKRTVTRISEVLPLSRLCLDVISQHIDDIGHVSTVPVHLFWPVLEKCSPQQLSNIEYYNPQYIDDTGDLWKAHCKKEFPNKKREEMETWREMYERCIEARAAKLASLTKNIQDKWKKKQEPVKRTQLAYVDEAAKAPRDVRRKQMKYGTAGPSANLSTERVRQVTEQEPRAHKLPGASRQLSPPPPAAPKRHKKAPLMAKALKMAKAWRR